MNLYRCRHTIHPARHSVYYKGRNTIRCGLLLALLAPLAAQAHKPWLEPSKTVLSVGQWVTVDAAASTDPFVKDHNPLKLDNLLITAPDGSRVAPENTATGKLRSSFDLQLMQVGTYKIALVNNMTNASWIDNGQSRHWPPRGEPFTLEGFTREVPKPAQDLKVMQSIMRVETYVTAGKPSAGALQPGGLGLELVPVTSATPFNDWVAGEEAVFQLLIDGKPAPGLDVEVIADGARYRRSVDAVELKTDEQGRVRVRWPKAGLYWLSASITDDLAPPPARERRASYAGVFEVLPP